MEPVNTWIEEWLLLWPEDVKSGGESIRTKAKYCVNKMQKFTSLHKIYDKSTIFVATRLYLKDREENNWFATKRATYFIDKLGQGSLLQDYCEKILNPKKEEELPTYNPIDDYI